MKQASLILLALAVTPACGKHNEVDVLRHEAVAAATYYAPKLDALDQRVQAIFQRGASIPATTPGIDAVGARLTEARDMIVQLRGIVAPGSDKKSALEKQADAAAKDRRVTDLEKLVHDTHSTLERGMTIINADLISVESWISYFDRQALAPAARPAGGAPIPPAPAPPGAPTGAPAPAPAGGTAAPAPAAPAPGAPVPAAPAPAPGR